MRLPFHLLMLTSYLIVGSGCTHMQLQHNTSRQVKTISSIYEEQVLDNLAMFVCNAHATPFFSVPSQGTNQVNDSMGATAGQNAFTFNFWKFFSATGSRGMNQAWTLMPVVDPNRLKLMQCAYQKAVGAPGDECSKCCDVEKEWKGKTGEITVKVFNPITGELLLDPKTCEPWLDKMSGQPFVGCPTDTVRNCPSGKACPRTVAIPDAPAEASSGVTPLEDAPIQLYKPTIMTDPRTGEAYKYNVEKGEITIPKVECYDPCGITCGWVQCSTRWKDVPKCCGKRYGYHCGTYVWVDPGYEHEFSKLMFAIVDYASGTKASAPSGSTKEVRFYFDADGNAADVRNHATAVIATVKSDASMEDIRKDLRIVPTKAALEIATTRARLSELESLAANPKENEVDNAAAIKKQINRIETMLPAVNLPANAADPKTLNSTIKAMTLHIEKLKRLPQFEVQASGPQDSSQPAPSMNFGPPTQFNTGFGSGILQLQQQLNTVVPPGN